MDFKKDLANLNYGGMKEDDEAEGLIYLGSSKFDKLRRISLIKPISDRMEIKEGEEVNYYTNGEYIILKRNATRRERTELPLYSEESAIKFATFIMKYHELKENNPENTGEEIKKVLKELKLTEEEVVAFSESIKIIFDKMTEFEQIGNKKKG